MNNFEDTVANICEDIGCYYIINSTSISIQKYNSNINKHRSVFAWAHDMGNHIGLAVRDDRIPVTIVDLAGELIPNLIFGHPGRWFNIVDGNKQSYWDAVKALRVIVGLIP